jgi:hypothetical protein
MLTKTMNALRNPLRTRLLLRASAAAAVLTTLGAARAGGDPPAPTETKDLARLVGTWKGTGSMTMGSDKVDGIKINWSCRPISVRWGVACDGVMTGIPGMGRLEETDLFGYDPGGGKLHWFAVTNVGETHDHVGGRWTGQSAQFVYTGTQDGKPLKEVIDVSFKDKAAATFELRAETFVDGKTTSVLQGTARK